VFNVIYQQLIATYNSGCQIWSNWSTQVGLLRASTPTYHNADKT